MAEDAGLLLVDTDMLVLLTASGTLPEVVSLLGYAMEQVRRLPAAPHQVRKSSKFRETYGEPLLRGILDDVAAVREIDAPGDHELLERFGNAIDPGEAQLFTIATNEPCALLVTGDKRALRSVSNRHEMLPLQQLAGRVICLEAVLLLLVRQRGAAAVRAAFSPVIGHRTLSVVLSQNTVRADDTCIAALRSYFDKLFAETGDLLYDPDGRAQGA